MKREDKSRGEGERKDKSEGKKKDKSLKNKQEAYKGRRKRKK
jgi:hypothetical protein